MVRDVQAATAPDVAVARHPGAHGDSLFVDQDGRPYRLADPSIDASSAQRAAAAGALVVWDPCGCGGYCGYEWLDAEQRSGLGSVVPRGRIALYTGEHGGALLFVEESVTWGSTIT